jgi:polysaccharide export outer membrane protein
VKVITFVFASALVVLLTARAWPDEDSSNLSPRKTSDAQRVQARPGASAPTTGAATWAGSAALEKPERKLEGDLPENSRSASLSADYHIGAGDVLAIDVWGEPEASVASALVRPDGKISVPFVRELAVNGLTPTELESLLAEMLKEFVRGAQVTVLVREVNSQKVYVIGEVKKEGAIRLQAPITILQALAEAGGLTDYAKRRKIQIFRTENQKQTVYYFDYEAAVRGHKAEQNVRVMAGDTIVVPR